MTHILRRALFSIVVFVGYGAAALARSNPPPCWKDGPIKTSITDFITCATTQSSPDFAPPTERIAVFDSDGTLFHRPNIAFGNSDGDHQMLQWTMAGSGARFAGIAHHADATREYADNRQSKIGQLDKAWEETKAKGCTAGGRFSCPTQSVAVS